MTISKISFMAESALLNKYNTKTQTNPAAHVDSAKTESGATTPANNEQVQAEVANNKSTPQESGSSNKKAWVIGLSAAAVLTALGVFAGRKGYLGEGVQKFLGGIKKESGNLNHKSDDLLNDIELPTGNNGSSNPNITIIEPENAVPTGAKPEIKYNIEEPEKGAASIAGTGKNAENAEETILGKAPETPPATPKPETPVVNAENINVDEVNALINRSIPKLDYPTKVEVPDTKALFEESKYVLESIKTSGLKPNEWHLQTLPNGNSCHFQFAPNGTIEAYTVFDKQNKMLHHFYQYDSGCNFLLTKDNCTMRFCSEDKSLYDFSKTVDNNLCLNYNKYGLLDNITEHADGVKLSRKFEPQDNNGLVVTYYDPLSKGTKAIKMEAFQDGKLESELFLDGSPSMKVIKEINHEIK